MAETVTTGETRMTPPNSPVRRFRVLVVASHPVQYSSPQFRRMAEHPQLEIQVAYCSMQGTERTVDPQFGVEVSWDVPLLEGYSWVLLQDHSSQPHAGSFHGRISASVWDTIKTGNFDAVILYTGYFCSTFWIAIAAAKAFSIPILFGTDAHVIEPMDGRKWKTPLKRLLWPWLFRLADIVIVPSTGSFSLLHSLGIPEERIAITPYTVDNDWWISQADSADRATTRTEWEIPEDALVVLFCAKLQPWKRPQDLLRAFAQIRASDTFLVLAGDGDLRPELINLSEALGIAENLRFLGFVNQSKLPAVYRAADLLVLPSEYEAFGVVVNEAMLCKCPVAVSDHVGARFDLIEQDKTGFIYPVGNVQELAEILRHAWRDRTKLRCMGEAARARMAAWSPEMNVESTLRAIDRSVQRRPNRPSRSQA